jgi:hypothetical protein
MPRVVASAVCALAAHAVVYGTLWPADGAHGYFGWYQPLSVASLACVVALLAVPRLRRFVAWRPLSVAATSRSLAVSSLAFLLAQESLERTLASGHPAFAAFTPSQWLLLLVAVAAAAFALSFALRAVLGRAAVLPAPAPAASAESWSVRPIGRRRSRPLAERFALRAPPLFG